MHRFALVSAFLALGASAATITIEKKTEIQTGEVQQLAASFRHVVATHEGGYLVVVSVGAEHTVERFGASGQRLWARSLPIGECAAALACRNGELLFLAGGSGTSWRLVRASSEGLYLSEASLPTEEYRQNRYQSLAEMEDGFLVAGSVGSGGIISRHGYAVVRRLSVDLQTLWSRQYGDIPGDSAQVVFFLPVGSEGYLIGCEEYAVGFPISRIGDDGATIWKRIWTGDSQGSLAGPDRFTTAIRCADGGFLFGASSQTATGILKTAEHFGATDYWLVKVAADGSTRWDRSYGGTGGEQPSAILQTEDGGFLVTGTSFGSGVTGNKVTDGNGTWLLKLDHRGLKEAEIILPAQDVWPPQLLTSPSGYRQVGSGWIANVFPVRKARLEASGLGKPFNLDISSNLLHWTPLVVNFSGTLSFEEVVDASMKFYRVPDAP